MFAVIGLRGQCHCRLQGLVEHSLKFFFFINASGHTWIKKIYPPLMKNYWLNIFLLMYFWRPFWDQQIELNAQMHMVFMSPAGCTFQTIVQNVISN